MDRFVPRFVKDIVNAVRNYLRPTPQERKKQQEKVLAPKKISGQYRVQKQVPRPRRLSKAPSKIQLTEMSRYIALMRRHPAPQIVLNDKDSELIKEAYATTLILDPAVKNLIGNEASELDNQVIEEMANRLLDSEDSVDPEIHEIFRIENFLPENASRLLSVDPVLGEGMERKTYKAMLPALILATKFLLAPDMEKFWGRLMYGLRTTKGGKLCYLEEHFLEGYAVTMRKDFRDLLALLSERMIFRWEPQGSSDACFMHTFWAAARGGTGRTDLIEDIRERTGAIDENLAPVQYAGYIALNVNFLVSLVSQASPAYESVEKCAAFQVHFATVLIHELSHALYALVRFPSPESFVTPAELLRFIHFPDTVSKELADRIKSSTIPPRDSEPFVFNTDITNEVGYSVENALWDGHLLMSWDEAAARHFSLKATLTEETWDCPHMSTIVYDDWFPPLFRQTTWDNLKKHTDKLNVYSAFEVHRYVSDQKAFVLVRYKSDKPLENRPWSERTWRIQELSEEILEKIQERPGRALSFKRSFEIIKKTTGQFKGDPRKWFAQVRKKDVAEALKTGQ